MDSEDGNWFESESFWTALFPFMFPESSFTAAADNVPKIAALTGVSGGNVLDLACGPGRYAIPLAQAGYAVTGVDRTRFLLKIASERAVVPARMSNGLNRTCGTSFGPPRSTWLSTSSLRSATSRTRPKIAACWKTFSRASNRAGRLCSTTWARRFSPRDFADALPELCRTARSLSRQSIMDDWSRIEGEWILLADGPCHDLPPPSLALLRPEIRELLTSVGFTDISLFGFLSRGRPMARRHSGWLSSRENLVPNGGRADSS